MGLEQNSIQQEVEPDPNPIVKKLGLSAEPDPHELFRVQKLDP